MPAPSSSDLELCRLFAAWIAARVPVESVVLFGSRARGEPFAESDYDLIVVSKAFEDMPRRDRLGVLGDLWMDALRPTGAPYRAAEVHGYSPAEVLAMERPLVWDALDCGAVILDRGVWSSAQALYARLRGSGAIVPWPDRRGWTLDLDRIRAGVRGLAASSP